MPKANLFVEIRAEYFPAPLVAGIIARPVAGEVLWALSSQLDEEIETPFVELGLYEMPAARRQRAQRLREIYGRLHQEHFVFYNPKDEPVGWSYGHMLDESTFFMSWSGVAKAYQRRGIYTAFLQSLLPYLRALGYERVTSKHMVNNRPVLIAKIKAGFHIVGLSLDERFGAQVTLAHFFHQDRQDGFCRAFSLERRFPSPADDARRAPQ
jgi:RimJ/RimL family protein N-acetyltransferase